MEFNERLIQHRKRLGMSQEELGYNIGVSRQTVSKWELGETSPEMSKLVAMSELFEISLDELIKGEASSGYHSAGGYEYKSKQTLWGLPLVHINVTGGRNIRGIRKAKGIIAIGDMATGVVALGGMAVGVLSIGGVSFGLLSLGGLAVGLLGAFGGLALGLGVSLGGVAMGYFALGGSANGVYALGGAAVARDIALGDYAKATIAMGNDAEGVAVFGMGVTPAEFKMAVNQLVPKTPEWVIRIFTRFLG